MIAPNARTRPNPAQTQAVQPQAPKALDDQTCSRLVLPELEAAEVDRRAAAFQAELAPTGEIGVALARRAATLSVRMERCVEYENVCLTDRVRRAEADFVAPEGVTPEQAARLRAEAGKLAMFDPSREATLARRYEAAAERGFFRALKELRQVEKAARADREAAIDSTIDETLASFSRFDEEADAFEARYIDEDLRTPTNPRLPADFAKPKPSVDVPITVGRAR